MMFDLRRIALLVLPWLLVPAAAFGQYGEAHDVEVIEPPKVKPSPDENKPDLRQAEREIVEKTNGFRKQQGRPQVKVSPKLREAAAYFAGYMARADRYGHTADGQGPADRAKKYGYQYCIVLENIAYQYGSRGFTTSELSKGFFEGWKHSPGHRRNMLDPDVTWTGVAVARSDRTGYYYAVQMFGRPRSEAIGFSIANDSDATVKYALGERVFELAPRYTRTHTTCRPPKVRFSLPGDRSTSVKPASGDRFAITGEAGNYRVRKE
jgi:uncharacterized protein YkwD